MTNETKIKIKDDPQNIYQRINAAMRDINPIEKGQINKAQGFKFRGVDDVYNHLHPIMAKHGIFTVTDVISEKYEERTTKSGGALIYRILKVKFTMYAIDGSYISGVVIGEGMDSGDKGANKAMAVAHKYFLLQLFSIPTAQSDDPDKDCHAVISQKTAAKTQQHSEQNTSATVKFQEKKQTCGEDGLPILPNKDEEGGLECPLCSSKLWKNKGKQDYYYCGGYRDGCKYKYVTNKESNPTSDEPPPHDDEDIPF